MTQPDKYDLQNVKQEKRPDAQSSTLFRSCNCTAGSCTGGHHPNIKSKIITHILLKLSQNSKTQEYLVWDAQTDFRLMLCLSDCMPASTWTRRCYISIMIDLDWFQRVHKNFKRQSELIRLRNVLHFIFWTVHFDDSTVWKRCHAFKWRWGMLRHWLLQLLVYSTVFDIPQAG